MPESAIKVRPVEPEDWPDIAEIFEQPGVIFGTMQLPFRSRASRKKRLEERDPANPQLGAVIDGKLIGVIGLERPPAQRRAHVGSLGMGVHDAWQGRGAGSALLSALLELTDRWLNIRRMELTVYADNARAIGLYEKHGFEREGLHRDYAFRDGALVDALAMARIRPR
ncbi:MAG TPA: GNAT family N-acetyltransferase [Caulobacteraceae bacterium]|nr:GNAT family N-acetyltransferase [Caulobacteraceae bacterium]